MLFLSSRAFLILLFNKKFKFDTCKVCIFFGVVVMTTPLSPEKAIKTLEQFCTSTEGISDNKESLAHSVYIKTEKGELSFERVPTSLWGKFIAWIGRGLDKKSYTITEFTGKNEAKLSLTAEKLQELHNVVKSMSEADLKRLCNNDERRIANVQSGCTKLNTLLESIKDSKIKKHSDKSREITDFFTNKLTLGFTSSATKPPSGAGFEAQATQTKSDDIRPAVTGLSSQLQSSQPSTLSSPIGPTGRRLPTRRGRPTPGSSASPTSFASPQAKVSHDKQAEEHFQDATTASGMQTPQTVSSRLSQKYPSDFPDTKAIPEKVQEFTEFRACLDSLSRQCTDADLKKKITAQLNALVFSERGIASGRLSFEDTKAHEQDVFYNFFETKPNSAQYVATTPEVRGVFAQLFGDSFVDEIAKFTPSKVAENEQTTPVQGLIHEPVQESLVDMQKTAADELSKTFSEKVPCLDQALDTIRQRQKAHQSDIDKEDLQVLTTGPNLLLEIERIANAAVEKLKQSLKEFEAQYPQNESLAAFREKLQEASAKLDTIKSQVQLLGDTLQQDQKILSLYTQNRAFFQENGITSKMLFSDNVTQIVQAITGKITSDFNSFDRVENREITIVEKGKLWGASEKKSTVDTEYAESNSGSLLRGVYAGVYRGLQELVEERDWGACDVKVSRWQGDLDTLAKLTFYEKQICAAHDMNDPNAKRIIYAMMLHGLVRKVDGYLESQKQSDPEFLASLYTSLRSSDKDSLYAPEDFSKPPLDTWDALLRLTDEIEGKIEKHLGAGWTQRVESEGYVSKPLQELLTELKAYREKHTPNPM